MDKNILRKLFKNMKPVKYDFKTDYLINYIEKFENILCFYPLENEPDILNFLFSLNKNLYFPKINNCNEMDFYKVDKLKDFSIGKFGVMEPLSTDKLNSNENLLIFCPGLFFTESGNRLGHGKGYYDNFLSKVKNSVKIGVCYNYYIIKNIHIDVHDVSMDYIFTGKELIKCKK